MAEIKREPVRDNERDTVTFDADHTHSDILRYVIADLGADDAGHLMSILCKEACHVES